MSQNSRNRRNQREGTPEEQIMRGVPPPPPAPRALHRLRPALALRPIRAGDLPRALPPLNIPLFAVAPPVPVPQTPPPRRFSSVAEAGTAMSRREGSQASVNQPEPKVEGSLKKGGVIHKTGLYRLHKGEIVVPKEKAKKARKVLNM